VSLTSDDRISRKSVKLNIVSFWLNAILVIVA